MRASFCHRSFCAADASTPVRREPASEYQQNVELVKAFVVLVLRAQQVLLRVHLLREKIAAECDPASENDRCEVRALRPL